MSGYRVHVDSDRVLGELLDEIAEQLAGNGHEVVRGQDLRMPDGEYGDGPLHAIVVNSRTPVRADFLDLHPELRGVVFASSGVNSIDLGDATRRGVLVANGATPENHGSMAEATIMLALALKLRLIDRLAALAQMRPRPTPAELDSHCLHGATIGLVGFGRIAQGVCRMLAGWGVARILCYTRTPVPQAWPGVEFCSLETCLSESDVVSIHLPLLSATRG